MQILKPNLSISSYTYSLNEDRIAKYPLTKRDDSKLLLYQSGNISESKFSHLVDFLPDNALLVFNNTKVIHARLLFRKESGAKIEVFCLEPVDPSLAELALATYHSCEWKCIVGNLKRWKYDTLSLQYCINGVEGILSAVKKEHAKDHVVVSFSWTSNHSFGQIIEACGQLPIPPYLNREAEEADLTSYQTVYAKHQGSVAAPTAGLHFTNDVFKSFEGKNIKQAELTLHVGAGTFKPFKAETIDGHVMHCERFSIKQSVLKLIIDNLQSKKIIAVGTTSVRTLESLYYLGLKIIQDNTVAPESLAVNQWEPYVSLRPAADAMTALKSLLSYMNDRGIAELTSSTSIMIAPAYKYKVTNGLITNFHQPESTLLLLVAALIGSDWRKVYEYALNNNFRFLSYGDSSLLMP